MRGCDGRDQKELLPAPTMEDLTDDLLIEILSRLPFKVATQCQCINKKFRALISNHQFAVKQAVHLYLRSSMLICGRRICPTTFYGILLHPPHDAMSIPSQPHEVRILASSNGLLLLLLRSTNLYCVCNPITGDYRMLRCPNIGFNEHAGLAIDSRTVSSTPPQYKVVTISIKKSGSGWPLQLRYEFEVFSQGFWGKSSRSPVYENSQFVSGKSVCLNGCLHWLRKDGSIIAFDVVEEKSRLIKKPPGFELGNSTWFGITDGMITMVLVLRKGIVVCTLCDYIKESWKFTTKIPHIAIDENGYNHVYPISFDGMQLLMLLRHERMDGEIFKYELCTKLWKHIGSVPMITDSSQVFVPFVPTLAKVSLVLRRRIPICLHQLRRLLNLSIEV